MLWRRKKLLENKGMKSEAEALKLDPEAKVLVKWSRGDQRGMLPLPNGRHLIGHSDFATVRIPEGKNRISASLTIHDEQITLRCLLKDPCLYVEGQKLSPGETITVGDVLECYIGRCLLTITASSLINLPAHQDHAKDEITDLCGETPVKLENAVRNRENCGVDGPKRLGSEATKFTPGKSVDDIRKFLCRKLLDQLELNQCNLSQLDTPEIREKARLRLRKLVSDMSLPSDFPLSKVALEENVYNEVMGLGPLEPLLADPTVTEIMVNSREQIYVEQNGVLSLSQATFSSEQALLNVISRVVSKVGRRIDASCPIVDARLLDGSRVNAVIPPLALKGPCLTIRRFSKVPLTISQLITWGSVSEDAARFLQAMVYEKKNIVVSGGTGSGKTTLLNVLSSFIPEHERIVTIEDAAELQLQQQHVISLETRPANLEGTGAVTIRDLVKNVLRMRPDRIIVGECRGAEALDMLQAMNTGHDGSLTTAHANSAADLLRRLETMVLMAGMELPLKAIREQIASAVTLIVQQTRCRSGKRQITEITWVKGLSSGGGQDVASFVTESLFERSKESGQLQVKKDACSSFLAAEQLEHLQTEVFR